MTQRSPSVNFTIRFDDHGKRPILQTLLDSFTNAPPPYLGWWAGHRAASPGSLPSPLGMLLECLYL